MQNVLHSLVEGSTPIQVTGANRFLAFEEFFVVTFWPGNSNSNPPRGIGPFEQWSGEGGEDHS